VSDKSSAPHGRKHNNVRLPALISFHRRHSDLNTYIAAAAAAAAAAVVIVAGVASIVSR
jgi:hypothetical protein